MAGRTDWHTAKARFFPESVYSTPSVVLTDADLNIGEKLAILVGWRLQVSGRIKQRADKHELSQSQDLSLRRDIDTAIGQLVAQLEDSPDDDRDQA